MKTLLFYFVIIINFINVYSQIEIDSSSTTLYPYDGDVLLHKFDKRIHVYPPISFKKSVLFLNSNFDSLINFRDAIFEKRLNAINCSFNQYSNFIGANFFNNCSFIKCEFNEDVSFENSSFNEFNFISCISNKSMNFNSTVFNSTSSLQNSTFKKHATFYQAKFMEMFDFSSTINHGQIDFRHSHFNDIIYFDDAIFNEKFYLSSTSIEKTAYFNGCKFYDLAEFYNVIFKGDVYFSASDFGSGTIFGPIVNFEKSKFFGTIDIRSSNFDKLKNIHLYGIKFQNGKLLLYWDQLKAEDTLKISLSSFSVPKDQSKIEYYRRIETIYFQLRDNFLAQGNKTSADNVMYELGWQKKEILGGAGNFLYGWFLGWGYQPWRYILFIIFPLISFFAFIWYRYFYHLVVQIVWKKIPSSYSHSFSGDAHLKEKKVFKTIIKVFNHKEFPKGNIATLARIWHVLHFSASVLLGIRFKKEWIETKNKIFLRVITLEWIIGIVCYIIFALCIKSERFSIIKGIFGF